MEERIDAAIHKQTPRGHEKRNTWTGPRLQTARPREKARGDPESRCLHGIESHRGTRNQRVQKSSSTTLYAWNPAGLLSSYRMASREHQEMLSARPDNFETPKTPFSERVAKQATASSLQKLLQETLLQCRPGSEDEADAKYASFRISRNRHVNMVNRFASQILHI